MTTLTKNDLTPSQTFLKSLRKGQFVLVVYYTCLLEFKPDLAIIKTIDDSGFGIEIVYSDGTTFESTVNEHGYCQGKPGALDKLIAPLSDLDKIIELINKCRQAHNDTSIRAKETILIAKFKQECFEAITNQQTTKSK